MNVVAPSHRSQLLPPTTRLSWHIPSRSGRAGRILYPPSQRHIASGEQHVRGQTCHIIGLVAIHAVYK